MEIKEFKLGSDPELFLIKRDTKELFPAIGLISGTKNKPLQMKGLTKGFTWQIDNCSLEFNIPPANSVNEWVNNHTTALDYIKKNIPDELEIHIVPSGNFDKKYLDMPGAREFGCSQTLNAWTQEVNPKPYNEDETLRCNGAHIHIGFDNYKDLELCETVIKTLDLFLGIPSLFLDNDTKRKLLYGKAGEFRFTDFGCEYRVLSNFWLTSEELMRWVYNQVEESIKFINNGNSIDDERYDIEHAINNYDLNTADKLLQKYNIKLPQTKLQLV